MKFGIDKVPRRLDMVDVMPAAFWLWFGLSEADDYPVLKVVCLSVWLLYTVLLVFGLSGRQPFIMKRGARVEMRGNVECVVFDDEAGPLFEVSELGDMTIQDALVVDIKSGRLAMKLLEEHLAKEGEP